jgi:hypothetical protein
MAVGLAENRSDAANSPYLTLKRDVTQVGVHAKGTASHRLTARSV